LYGRLDVDLCADSLARQRGLYSELAARLPREASWFVTPLKRTRRTAQAIQSSAGIERPLTVEPGLTEQDLGQWQGLAHGALPARLTGPAHPFWPLGAGEVPPGGENMDQVITRVGATLDRLASTHPGENLICVSHGGAIRAAVAHALGAPAQACLHFSIQNLSLTVLERCPEGWRVMTVNEGAEI
jgi:broad specificity phosphatase PhoE